MEFNSENVKNLIARYREWISDVEKAEAAGKNNEARLLESVRSAVKQGIFSRWIQDSLVNGKTDIPSSLAGFERACWNYSDFYDSSSDADRLDQNYHERIRENLSALNCRKNGLRWLFASKKKKEDAENAFNDLLSLEAEYGSSADAIAKHMQNMQMVSLPEIETDIQKKQIAYLNLLSRHLPQEDLTEPLIDLFAEPIDKIKQYRTQIQKVDNSVNDCKAKIAERADRARGKAAYSVLNDIPIDELKREAGSGIRLKPLKDHGFNTVADVYSANIYELSSISGVSELSARSLKRAAADYADEVGKTSKFRISADNKTPEVTALLRQVYQYKSNRQIIDSLAKLHQADSKIDKDIDNLQTVGNGSTWLFYDDSVRSIIQHSYNDLGAAVYGDYGHTAENLTGLKEVFASDDSVWTDFQKDPVPYFNIIEETCPGLLGNGDSRYGLPEDLAKEIQDEAFFPDGLTCTLRRYQEWGVKYILHQKKVLLGDEMGLGKTIQAIATMVSLKNTGATHFLVVCPASVLTNWVREISSKSKLRAIKVHGAGKQSAIRSWIKNGGVAVTNFETTRYFDLKDNFKYDLLIVDEAHYIKNTNAMRSAYVRSLAQKTDRLLFMSGTPLENNVDEMISLIDVLQPKIADSVRNYAYMSRAEQFRKAIAPVYYRRKREDVLTELPEKEEIEEWCDLKPKEKEIYEDSVMQKKFMEMRRVSWNVDDLADSSKADHLKDIIEQARSEDRKVLVFSYFLDTLSKIADAFERTSIGPITGKVPVQKRQELIDQFAKAPAGTLLLAQIQSGGTGLNIQSASVVVICEPQLKPSIENQAISRAYRMGQTRNVLVYRLLCSDCVDERMVEKLKSKQAEFDAFADESVAAENTEIDKETQNNIIQEEIDRINNEKGQPSRKDKDEDKPKHHVKPSTVVGRIRQVAQPYGGYINPRQLHSYSLGNGIEELHKEENIYPFQMGMVVDYMTRFMSGSKPEKAFEISLAGAGILAGSSSPYASDGQKAAELLESVHGLDDDSIIAAAKLTGYDVCYRNSIDHYKPVDEIVPDEATIENARIMVNRGVNFLDKCGPKVLDGFTLEGGYTKIVVAGDGDYLTKDALWDFKVSKQSPTKDDNTLQILMYWRMGLHSVHPEFKNVKFIGIFNPRLNNVYYLETKEIPDDVIRRVEKDVIGYE